MSANPNFQPIPTRAALALKNQKNYSLEFKVFSFIPKTEDEIGAADINDKNSPTRQVQETSKTCNNAPDDKNIFDLKKARNEVLKFAISNQRNTKNQRKMETFQLTKLGAKPKKRYKNYKELLEERKRLKTIREERLKFHELGKNQAGRASVKCRSKSKFEKSKKKRAPVTNIQQHYGTTKSETK